MKLGNELEHLADEAINTGRAEAAWLMLRNTYFRDGTPTDGWEAMVEFFSGLGLNVMSEQRLINHKQMKFVVLAPKAGHQ